ncbi:Tyrosine-protein kinase Src64B [Frankliniella fusca]|uniref:Tyrosine-protein kinase Src64B n=1 Tax=Frankliniella fusca TaxID=407009 RepID=A0AAE1H4N2_9NEOP|nr:Tyrosine-protein kinase Src64B [Frankliniella fusca]
MGACCSKSNSDTSRQSVLQHGYKLNETTDLGAHIGSVGTLGNEPRYIQEPNRIMMGIGSSKRQQGVDIIRTPTTPFHPSSGTKGRVVVAVYNYTSREAADLSFAKGDRMEVIDDR